jgi:hypothetical protein
MLQKLKDLFNFSASHGLNFPAAYDKNVDGPSVSLLFAHLSFYLAFISVAILMYKDTNLGTIAAMTLAGLYFIFYMLRKLTHAKVDLDDRSFDLSNEEKEK